jgi:hypothetical protein
MHVQLPKPLHGWREFAGEVGVIVLGVLIAFGAQQLVENWQWRSNVRDADRRMTEELSYDVTFAYERFAIAPCLRPRLTELRDQLLRSDPTWPGSRANFANDLYKSGFPAVYRTPNRPWSQAAWQTALSSGVIEHFQPRRAQDLAALFEVVALLKQSQSEEQDVADTLGDLAFAGPMSPAERRANLKVVARLDALDALILLESRILIEGARDAGIHVDRSSLERLLDQQRSYRGTCVRNPESF